MTQHSIIEHRANYHFLKLEEDYIAICPGKHSHCKAAILSLLEHWMNSKRTETSNDDDLFIYMSYPQFVKHLFNLYGRSMVIICLEELEQETLIMKRPYIDAFNQDTFEYRLNRPVIQAKLNALPELPSKSIIGSSKVNEGSSKTNYPHSKVNEGSSENKRGGSLKVNEGSFKSKRNIDTTQIPNIDTTQIDREERESSPNTLANTAVVSSDTAHAEYPLITFADCLSYLQEQGVAPRGEDAVQIMVQARTLYAHKHPRYEYRARPGLSEHPDDQLPSKQNEQVFTNDAPQGDTHATASGHSHWMGEPAARDVDGAGSPSQDRSLVAPEIRPVLEAQEITEGDTHASRVPTVPRADHPASLERDAAGHPQSDNHCAARATDDLPVVHPVGSGTPGPEAGRDGKDTSPLTPAQSLPLPQAEQAALGTPKPLAEPDMSGKWSHEKCVEYAEWCNQRRYTDKMHEEQVKAAHAIHKNDVILTLEQFKQAYDERNDAWWKEHKGKLHVNDMKARGASGIDRVHEMLQRIEDAASKCRAQTPRVLVPAPSPNQPITNIRELVRQREALRAAALVGV